MRPQRRPDSGSPRGLPNVSLPLASAANTRSESDNKGVLYLKRNHVTFEAPSKRESVFFDECNREIISLTGGIDGKTKVVFQSTDKQERIELLLPIDKRILSIKLNSIRTILAYHIERGNIELINLKSDSSIDGQPNYQLDDKRYIQPSRVKNCKLIGFQWTGPSELVLITDLSVEYYHVDANKRRLKHIKLFQSSTNWFAFQPNFAATPIEPTSEQKSEITQSILMVSTGSLSNSMQPYYFTRGQVMKLQRFDVEGYWHDNDKLELFERSITLGVIYNSVRLLVLQHESLNTKSKGAQILIYTVDLASGVTSRTHTLDLDVGGRFAINILDNLVLAHDQPSKSSFIFDISVESTEKSDCPRHFVSLTGGQPMRPPENSGCKGVEMYSLNWVFFRPNFIVDARLGLLTTVNLDLEAMEAAIPEDLVLLNFLSRRRNSEMLILEKCRHLLGVAYRNAVKVAEHHTSPLAHVSAAFETLSQLVVSAPTLESAPGDRKPHKHEQKSDVPIAVSITQDEVERKVFRQFDATANDASLGSAHLQFVSAALLEFVFLVRKCGKIVDCCIYERLVKSLVHGRKLFQIAQMIRAEIIVDSKQLACALLNIGDRERIGRQLGVDMLQRLGCPADIIAM